jgi:hypothetical protein
MDRSRSRSTQIWPKDRTGPDFKALYPAVQEEIIKQLTTLHEVGVVLILLTIRAIMVAVINKRAPELFETINKDKTQFKCSEAYVRKFLYKTMGWSERRATKAAQK